MISNKQIENDKKRILLVEDDDDLRELMSTYLVEYGFSVVGTSSGAQVESLLYKHMPDVALVDIGLPDIDGFTVTQNITSDNLAPAKTSVIIISANDDLQHKIRGFLCGAKKYISKPFDMDEVIEQIDNIIHRNIARSNNDVNAIA